ncbi:hypothetical protein H696_06293 [Fonticula alba]|uniref:Uncharacterized protein n=1 Tax=Fonticula alba TaxID=691883 RepID=A0A058Z018_FONAL|nr:hypothetical protein H696_06293 [Fonticula alba]KCV67288.1 hypothetical protein H696_06293 [Fonticula alba]|eukprot:XP_009498310.1 hypothetical protein H696_06293 [Fonticula alba]
MSEPPEPGRSLSAASLLFGAALGSGRMLAGAEAGGRCCAACRVPAGRTAEGLLLAAGPVLDTTATVLVAAWPGPGAPLSVARSILRDQVHGAFPWAGPLMAVAALGRGPRPAVDLARPGFWALVLRLGLVMALLGLGGGQPQEALHRVLQERGSAVFGDGPAAGAARCRSVVDCFVRQCAVACCTCRGPVLQARGDSPGPGHAAVRLLRGGLEEGRWSAAVPAAVTLAALDGWPPGALFWAAVDVLRLHGLPGPDPGAGCPFCRAALAAATSPRARGAALLAAALSQSDPGAGPCVGLGWLAGSARPAAFGPGLLGLGLDVLAHHAARPGLAHGPGGRWLAARLSRAMDAVYAGGAPATGLRRKVLQCAAELAAAEGLAPADPLARGIAARLDALQSACHGAGSATPSQPVDRAAGASPRPSHNHSGGGGGGGCCCCCCCRGVCRCWAGVPPPGCPGTPPLRALLTRLLTFEESLGL